MSVDQKKAAKELLDEMKGPADVELKKACGCCSSAGSQRFLGRSAHIFPREKRCTVFFFYAFSSYEEHTLSEHSARVDVDAMHLPISLKGLKAPNRSFY